MKENTEIFSQSRPNLINPNENNYQPDIIEQVDKIISKYKNQLEQIKPRRYLEETNFNNFDIREEDDINNNYNTYNKFNNDDRKNMPFLTQEMEKDNIKLGSALSLEKSKVVQLLNLLKIKETEINDLKNQIDNFEIKLNEIKTKYQDIIRSMEQEQTNKLNELYNKMSDENNRIQLNLNENQRNNELMLGKYNYELSKNEKINKIFFDFFNKNIEIYKKTEILIGENLLINEKDYSEEKAILAIETWDKLINKLFQDNKDLYNELVRLKGEIGNYDIIMNQNSNYIQKENESLKQLVEKMNYENNFLKNKMNIGKNILNNDLNEHHHVIHSICKHCVNNYSESNKRKNGNNRDVSPIQKLRLKINHLENQIKNKSFI